MFGWFKKKEEPKKDYFDPTNPRLNQMRKGGFVDYDLKTWQILGVGEYDWGNNMWADEFHLQNDNDNIYLYVEEEGDTFICSLAKKIDINDVHGENLEDVLDIIVEEEIPPRKVVYKGKIFVRQNEAIGHYREQGGSDDDWSELVSWTFKEKDGNNILVLERWGEDEFAGSIGFAVKEHEFSGFIMP
jgi:Domain of unknown function (DUF4178)